MFKRKVTIGQVCRAVESGEITVSQLQAIIDHSLPDRPPKPPVLHGLPLNCNESGTAERS